METNPQPNYSVVESDERLPVERKKTVGDESYQPISGPKMKAETVTEQLLANDSLGAKNIGHFFGAGMPDRATNR
jgi:hypothetical protein